MTFAIQVLAAQATIIANQQTILTAIKSITPPESDSHGAIITALAQMETQIMDIQAQVDVAPAPSPAPDSAPQG